MATNARSTVVGVFERRDQAERAVQALEAAGFRDDQIGMAVRGSESSNVAGYATEDSTSAAGGAVTGAVLGGVLGAIGALVIPGVGPVLALGTLGTALAGAVVGAGVGALAGGLIGMGVPEDEARYYDEEFQAGRTIVTVRADGKYNVAQNILRSEGAYDVETRDPGASSTTGMAGATGVPPAQPAGEHSTGNAGIATGEHAHEHSHPGQGMHDHPRQTGHHDEIPASAGPRTDRADVGGRTMELREEQLSVNRERVQTGEVQVRKEVVGDDRTIVVPVQREEVVVERRPVAGQPSSGPIGEGASDRVRIPVTEERVEVEKRPVVTEQINVGTRQVQDNRQISDTVRRGEARIDSEGQANVRGMGQLRRSGESRWEDVMPQYRASWQQRYGSQGGRWEEYEPAYRYGWEMANDQRYRDRPWSEVEGDLRRDWDTYHSETPWDRVKDAIHDAWHSLTGARR